jgi:hypothetical protein
MQSSKSSSHSPRLPCSPSTPLIPSRGIPALPRFPPPNTSAELEAALWEALADWNQHPYPYQWKKKPQVQLPPWGGYGFCKTTQRENH